MKERMWVRLEWSLLLMVLVLFSIVASVGSPAYGVGYDTGDPATSNIILSADTEIVVADLTEPTVAVQIVVPALNIAGYDTGDPKVITERNKINSITGQYAANTKEVSGTFRATIVSK